MQKLDISVDPINLIKYLSTNQLVCRNQKISTMLALLLSLSAWKKMGAYKKKSEERGY